MSAIVNRQVTLSARPVGFPQLSDFRLVEAPVPQPAPGQALVRTLWLSVDPYMRGRMSDAKSYAEPVSLGGVMVGSTVAQVIESRDPALVPGDFVTAYTGWQDYALVRSAEVRKLDPAQGPLTLALSVMGHIGMTAYFGLLDICDPKPGETVLVSGAAGAVGSLVGQIARIGGCRVVGIAGSDDKIRWLTDELGFDAAFNYKKTDNYLAQLREHCPSGIDVYFDNVGGAISDAAFLHMNVHGRVSICGQISLYNAEKPETGPRVLPLLIIKRLRVEGFLVSDYFPRVGEALKDLGTWLAEGRLKYRESIVDGLENAPAAFLGMLRGENIGKQLVRVAQPQS